MAASPRPAAADQPSPSAVMQPASSVAVQPTASTAALANPSATQPTSASSHGWSFQDVLSALNPLQYLPVVGTLYRAVTGDVIPEALQRFGSFVVSGLLGGPIGLAINVATTVGEKITGIDPDVIVATQFHHVPATSVATTPTAAADLPGSTSVAASPASSTQSGLAAAPDAELAALATDTKAPGSTASDTALANIAAMPTMTITAPRTNEAVPAQRGWTAEQLAAYGVRTLPAGTLKLGDVEGADVLNTLQLVRLAKAAAAYSASRATPAEAAVMGG